MNRSQEHSVSSEYGKLEQGVSFLTLGMRATRPRLVPEGVEGREQRGFVRLGGDPNSDVETDERGRGIDGEAYMRYGAQLRNEACLADEIDEKSRAPARIME